MVHQKTTTLTLKILKNINDILLKFIRIKPDNAFGTILMVSNTGFGDTILSTPAIKTMKKSFPRNRILFLVNKKYSKLFINYEYADEIMRYTGGYINLFLIIFKCRLEKVTTILLLHANSPEDIFLSVLSGANNVYKWTDNVNHEYRQLFVNAANTKMQHHIEKKLDLVRHFSPSIIDTKMEISGNYRLECRSFMLHEVKGRLIGIQLGAQDTYKIWPVENVITLCKKLIVDGCHIVLFGATAYEANMAEEVVGNINDDNLTNLCCKTAIEELPCILKQLDLLVTNDTGILHLAIALSVKTLSLFSPTSAMEFGAYQDRSKHFHIQKDGSFVNNRPKKQRSQDAMRLITVSEVYNKIIEIF